MLLASDVYRQGCHTTVGQVGQQPFALIADLPCFALLGTSEPPLELKHLVAEEYDTARRVGADSGRAAISRERENSIGADIPAAALQSTSQRPRIVMLKRTALGVWRYVTSCAFVSPNWDVLILNCSRFPQVDAGSAPNVSLL